VVTRHPERPNDVAVRYSGIWQPQPGQLLDFAPIEQELRRLCATYAVLEVAYDPYQLHDMAMRLKSEGVANFKEFKQGIDRLKADKQLQDLIMGRRIAHDGNPLLRQHIDNANIKKGGQDGIRLVKRSTSLKIDAAVSLSMAANRILYYNV
jgi:phage terminase large subunit-like protein